MEGERETASLESLTICAGKSTVLKILSGILAPDEGEIVVRGTPRQGLVMDNPQEQSIIKVGMVFPSGALFDSLTVGENVGFLLYEHTKLPTSVIEERVAEVKENSSSGSIIYCLFACSCFHRNHFLVTTVCVEDVVCAYRL